ncbi:hypothetical protein CPB84DRAFT_1844767 [Gymnopilus junonius]|uniref:Uncharacterized protein n=1 Tax=Gymnopilus junonius TaxID=109634 RepID=A0A9P5TQZ4_GYMJU|nr:hypothetical protein CPB84DRAFT_1844767 [Gymnopilus junonius]
MSAYAPLYVTPASTIEAILSSLGTADAVVANNVPFWFHVFEEGQGYIIAIPNTDFSMELSNENVQVNRQRQNSQLFIIQNTARNQDLILDGRLEMLARRPVQSLEVERTINLAPGIDVTINTQELSGNLENTNSLDGGKTIVIKLQSSPASGSLEMEQTSGKITPSKSARLVFSQDIPVPTTIPGKADIIAFGTTGVTIVRNPSVEKHRLVISSYGFDAVAGGWKKDKHVRLIADTTGNGLGDVVGFGDQGVCVSLNNGDNTFQDPKLVLSEFSFSTGWRVEKHLRFMADLRGTGRADIIGFGDEGVYVSLNNGNGTFASAKLINLAFAYNGGGWRLEKHPRFLADLTGNGLPDIVGFGNTAVSAIFNNGDGTFQPSKTLVQGLYYDSGWRVEKNPRFVVDLTGDGKADLLGFADDGIYIALNNGDGTFQSVKKVSSDFSLSNGGWLVEKHPRFVVDLAGNGCGDIIGFGDAGVYVGINNGDGTFQPIKHAIAGFGCNLGWRVMENPRFVADLTGNGRVDIIGFGNEKVFVSYNDGNGNFKPMEELVGGFGHDGGWTIDKTVRYIANVFS